MSPSSPNAAEFFDLIGRLRRSANTASRYGQVDELQRIADGLVRWQAHVRTEICRALEINPPTSVSWEAMIERVRNEHNRANQADTLADAMATVKAMDEGFSASRAESPTKDALNGVIKP